MAFPADVERLAPSPITAVAASIRLEGATETQDLRQYDLNEQLE